MDSIKRPALETIFMNVLRAMKEWRFWKFSECWVPPWCKLKFKTDILRQVSRSATSTLPTTQPLMCACLLLILEQQAPTFHLFSVWAPDSCHSALHHAEEIPVLPHHSCSLRECIRERVGEEVTWCPPVKYRQMKEDCTKTVELWKTYTLLFVGILVSWETGNTL